jgi:hypothetical protein
MKINTQAIINLRPGAAWSLDGDDYSGLEWLDQEQTKPTEQELVEETERVVQEQLRNLYQRKRRLEYPPLGDQLDALWKGGDAAEEMLAKVQAIKDKYPKPGQNPVGDTSTSDPMQGTNEPD